MRSDLPKVQRFAGMLTGIRLHPRRRAAGLLVMFLCITVAGAGCGTAEPETVYPTAAEMERASDANYTVAMLYSLCRDADLGKHRDITPGIREMTAKVMRAARLHPNEKYDSELYSTPAEALHLMADASKCMPDLARRLEIGARDSSDRQTLNR